MYLQDNHTGHNSLGSPEPASFMTLHQRNVFLHTNHTLKPQPEQRPCRVQHQVRDIVQTSKYASRIAVEDSSQDDKREQSQVPLSEAKAFIVAIDASTIKDVRAYRLCSPGSIDRMTMQLPIPRRYSI